jgi:hypothetical protein
VKKELERVKVLKAIARERLVKTEQAGKGLTGAVVISGGAVIACSYDLCACK